jgi:hypothetical protein
MGLLHAAVILHRTLEEVKRNQIKKMLSETRSSDPDIGCGVSLAWVHLRRYSDSKHHETV